MNNTTLKDKIILDTADVPALAEALGRKAPGDAIKFTGTGTLDDFTDGVATISIGGEGCEFNMSGPKAAPAKAAKPSAAAKMFSEDSEMPMDAENPKEDAAESA